MATTLGGNTPGAPAASGGGGWGWNPLTDITKATSAVGSFADRYLHVGNFNPGIGSTIATVANITPGLMNLGVHGAEDVYHGATTGNWSPALDLGKAVGGGLEHGILDTATDVASINGMAPWTNSLESGIQNVTGYKPSALIQYATRPGQGLLGGLLNDVLNASIAADGAGALAKLGEVGKAGELARIAEEAGQKSAIDAGASTDAIKEAGIAERTKAIANHAQEMAAKTGADPADLAAKINDRAAFLDRLDAAKGVLQAPLAPWKALRPLTQAAAETRDLTAGTVPNPAESLPGASQGKPAEAAANGPAQPGGVKTAEAAPPEPPKPGYARIYNAGQSSDQTMWTKNPDRAESYADGGPVRYVDLPEKSVDRLTVKSTAEGLNDIGQRAMAAGHQPVPGSDVYLGAHPYWDQVTQGAKEYQPGEAASPAAEAASTARPESVPAAYKSFKTQGQPVPRWAQAAMRHAPEPVVNLLAFADDMRMRHDYQTIQRQSVRYTAVEARRLENTPEIQAMRAKAEQMVKDRIPGVTPKVASKIVGERVTAALVFGPMWEQLEQLRPDLEAVQPGLANHVLHFYEDLPQQYNTPEFRQEINQIAESIKPMRANATAQLQSSAFLGDKGLANIDSTEPVLTRQEARLYQEAEQLLENAAKLTERRLPTADAIQMFKNNVMRMREQEAAASRSTAYIDRLERTFDNHLQSTTAAIAALQDKAGGILDQVAEGIENPSLTRTPTIFQPMVVAGRRMVEAVAQYPELEPILATVPKTFGDALDFAEANGWDPTYMPEMTPDRVKDLVNGTVRLGGTPGKEFTSGARMARTGALRLKDLNDQSIEGIIAGLNHAVQEDRTNLMVDWIDRTAASDIPKDQFGRQTIPRNMVAWDEVRRGMLGTESPVTGEQVAVGGTKMIPRALADAIKEYSQVGGPFAKAMRAITDPWRALYLTLSPAFYLRHFTGHVLLALANEGGFRLSDWVNAFRSARGGFLDLPEVTGQNITQSEIGQPGIVRYQSLGDAVAQGGPRAAANYVSQQLHNAVSVSDSFARAVVYFSDLRKGADPMVAMQHAMDALVDYGDLNPTERYIVRSIIPFYGFQKGILKTAMRMPLDHPLTTAVLMKVGEWQGEQAKDANGNPLPTAYQGVVNIAGHNINLKNFSPFKDLGALTTPEGLVSNLQYALQAVVRSGLGVPAPFTKAGVKVDAYGKAVPDVSFGGQLLASVTNSPLGGFVSQGGGTKTPGQAAASFLGVPVTAQSTLDNAGARNVLTTGEVAAAPQALQQQAAANPVDTQLLQSNLRKTPPTQPTPTGTPGQPAISQTQLEAAVQAAVTKQQQKAALTRATKGGGSSRRRSGGGSVRSSRRHGSGLKSFGKSGGGGLKHFGGGGKSFKVSRGSLRHGAIRSAFKGGGGASPFKTSHIRQGGPIKLQKRPK